MKKLTFSIILLISLQLNAQKHLTTFEKSMGYETTTYFDCINFYKKLAADFTTIKIKTIGSTDAGYPLHLVLFNNRKDFDKLSWQKSKTLVILINNGIHAGEPDGIDASMLLIKDAATGKIKIPDNVVLAVIPIYNIGGSLNRNSFSRVNQDGPLSYGFRGNAQNLNLNRDFAKADTRNTKAFTEIFHYLDPDIFIDNHVSDGADYQHTVTLISTQQSKLGGAIGTYLHDVFEPSLFKDMADKKLPMTPYVNFDNSNIDDGWEAFYDSPRFSTGYAALFQTIAFMPELHMLKPFKQRVESNYELMRTIINEGSKQAAVIKQKRKESIDAISKQQQFALNYVLDSSRFDMISFMGYTAEKKKSEVTGMNRLFYNHDKPFTKQVKFYNYFKEDKLVTKPKAYIIPQGWYNAIDLLKMNKVAMTQLQKDTLIEVEVYRIGNFKTRTASYEKHYPHYSVQVNSSKQKIQFLKGDYIIYTGQRTDRYLVEMLEPTGADSYFAWNFFDACLEQKEGYSDYRWEDVAADYLKQHPELKEKLEEKKKSDPAFAASSSQQLNFVYKNSPYYEPEHMRYPVYRLN